MTSNTSIYKERAIISLSSILQHVLGRQIMDGILIANECVDGRRRSKKSGLVCKIDLEKAYDPMDRDFLRWILLQKVFGDR